MDSLSQPPPTGPPARPASAAISASRLIVMAIGVRLFVDTSIQIFGPYLSEIAAGLGISIVALGALNSLRSLTGLAGPAYGSLAHRRGYRLTMRLQLLLGAAGVFLFSLSQNLWMAAAGMIMMGLGIFSFAPILQAYMSAHIPYERRARGLGTVEYAWALASIVGLSLAGVLIERFGWRAPFWLLGIGLVIASFVFRNLPATHQPHDSGSAASSTEPQPVSRRKRLSESLAIGQNATSAWAAIIAGGLSVFAIANVNIVYGAWLSETYGLTTSQIGLVALFMGLADLGGSILVSTSGDRLGKYRIVLAGPAGAIVAYLLLPVLDFRLLTAVISLVATRFAFEVGIVGNITLLSEQAPGQRAKVLTLASAAVTIGVALASLSGPVVYSNWGVVGIGLLSAGAVIGATILIIYRVTED